MRRRHHTGLIGAAGEYYAAAELSRRGRLATLTIKNAPGTDVLAQHLGDPGVLVSIQTKTSRSGMQFELKQKDELAARGQRDWFVFVGLGPDSQLPEFFVVPRDVVAGCLFANRKLVEIERNGRAATKGLSRRFLQAKWFEKYRDRWDLLEKPTGDALELVDPSWPAAALKHDLAKEMPTHPWLPRSGLAEAS